MNDDATPRYSRPATLRDLLTLIHALNQRNVEYMLIGGFAMIAHGFSRSTRDIDLLVPLDEANGKKLIEVLLMMPDQAARKIDLAWFTEGENIRVSDDLVIDIMFNANGESYDSLRPLLETIDIDGVSIPIASMEGLLKTKMTVRPKDIPDRLFLERHIQNNQQNKEDIGRNQKPKF